MPRDRVPTMAMRAMTIMRGISRRGSLTWSPSGSSPPSRRSSSDHGDGGEAEAGARPSSDVRHRVGDAVLAAYTRPTTAGGDEHGDLRGRAGVVDPRGEAQRQDAHGDHEPEQPDDDRPSHVRLIPGQNAARTVPAKMTNTAGAQYARLTQ